MALTLRGRTPEVHPRLDLDDAAEQFGLDYQNRCIAYCSVEPRTNENALSTKCSEQSRTAMDRCMRICRDVTLIFGFLWDGERPIRAQSDGTYRIGKLPLTVPLPEEQDLLRGPDPG